MKTTETHQTIVTLSLSVDEVVDLVDSLRWTAVAVQEWTPLPSGLNALWDVLVNSCGEARRSQRVAEAVGESDDDFVIPSFSDVEAEANAWRRHGAHA